MSSDASSPPEPFTYDIDDSEPITQAVVMAVAAVTGETPNPDETVTDEMQTPSLAPLYDVVDPDALERLFQSMNCRQQVESRITFDYAGCEVTVWCDGRITVRGQDDLAYSR